MEIVVHGCREYTHEGERCVECVSAEDAQFWGVYEVKENGEESNIADFVDKDDAKLFAAAKVAKGNRVDIIKNRPHFSARTVNINEGNSNKPIKATELIKGLVDAIVIGGDLNVLINDDLKIVGGPLVITAMQNNPGRMPFIGIYASSITQEEKDSYTDN